MIPRDPRHPKTGKNDAVRHRKTTTCRRSTRATLTYVLAPVSFVAVPSYDCALWRSLDSEKGCPYWRELEHFHNFSRARLYALLEEMGFKPLRFNVSLRYTAGMEIVARSVG